MGRCVRAWSNRFPAGRDRRHKRDPPAFRAASHRDHFGRRKFGERRDCAGCPSIRHCRAHDRNFLAQSGDAPVRLGRHRGHCLWIARWRGDALGAPTSRRSTGADHDFIADAVSRLSAGRTTTCFRRARHGCGGHFSRLALAAHR